MRYLCIFLMSIVLFMVCGCSLLQRMHPAPKVMTGLDVLQRDDFKILKGMNVGLVSNHSALNKEGKHILDLMLDSKNVKLVAIFAPEHGFRGIADSKLTDMKDETTGLPIYSLYGESLRPSPEMLENIDVLVFDIQDIGARFYTYISTMAICMEEAKKNNIRFIVLDRPNPITGLRVDGPVQDPALIGKFISYFPMPVMHGMTIGELATMFNREYGIQCDLEVITMEGWRRVMYFDDTGLPWINPSPNIRNVTQEILYPGVALTEYSNVSVGRGTETPFELLGAPWIDADALTAELQARNLPGIKFLPVHFKPSGSKFKDEMCHGMRFILTNQSDFMPVVTGIHIMDALYKMYPDTYEIDKSSSLVGKKAVVEMIKQRRPLEQIIGSWQEELQNFITIRNSYILYKE